MQKGQKNNQENNFKVIGILQPGYLPWLGFFEQVHQCDVFVIYDDVQFEKGSWRNRNRIKTPNGPQWLTVPVLLKGQGFPLINNVVINGAVPWQKKHIKAISLNYARAPFFDDYAEGLFEILNRPWKLLIDLDLALLYWFMKTLTISTPVLLASDLGIQGSNVQRLIDIIRSIGGKTFYEGLSGKNYIDVQLFEEAGISVIFQEYHHPIYPQLHGDFLSRLSIVDLLFNCGPDSLSILANS